MISTPILRSTCNTHTIYLTLCCIWLIVWIVRTEMAAPTWPLRPIEVRNLLPYLLLLQMLLVVHHHVLIFIPYPPRREAASPLPLAALFSLVSMSRALRPKPLRACPHP